MTKSIYENENVLYPELPIDPKGCSDYELKLIEEFNGMAKTLKLIEERLVNGIEIEEIQNSLDKERLKKGGPKYCIRDIYVMKKASLLRKSVEIVKYFTEGKAVSFLPST